MHSRAHGCARYTETEIQPQSIKTLGQRNSHGSIRGSSAKVSESLCHTYTLPPSLQLKLSDVRGPARRRRPQRVRRASENEEQREGKTKQKAEISCSQPTLGRHMKRKAKRCKSLKGAVLHSFSHLWFPPPTSVEQSSTADYGKKN